jgi:hypothetical protein
MPVSLAARLSLVLGIALSRSATAQPQVRVHVVVDSAVTTHRVTTAFAENGLRASLGRDAGVRVLTRPAVNADYVVTGRTHSWGDSIQLDVRVVDAHTLRLTLRDSVRVPVADLPRASVDLGRRVAERIAEHPRPPR